MHVRIKLSWIKTLEAQLWDLKNRCKTEKIGLRETYLLACQLYCIYESCTFMGEVRAKLDLGVKVWTIFIMWSIFTSIQIFCLIHCYHLSTTPAPILSWAYFNTPAILFNRSESVAVLWLAATLAKINKRKSLLKNRKKQSKLNAIAENFSFPI